MESADWRDIHHLQDAAQQTSRAVEQMARDMERAGVGTHRDMRPATWARTVARARREAEKLRALDFEVREPENFETPPHLRIASTSPDL